MFQALLVTWVVYVNAGMVIEGLLRLRPTGDLLVMSIVGAKKCGDCAAPCHEDCFDKHVQTHAAAA